MKKVLLNQFFLDKEKDISISIYRKNEDELTYIIETPNHKTGNLITNLAKLCKVETTLDSNNMKIISGTLPACINADNEIVYFLRLGGIKIATIFENGDVELKAKIPAITKTLMSQTKNYNLSIQKTIVKSYILKKNKFKTDLHTHERKPITRCINSIRNQTSITLSPILHQKIKFAYVKKTRRSHLKTKRNRCRTI